MSEHYTEVDKPRLGKQQEVIRDFMLHGTPVSFAGSEALEGFWWTLAEISWCTGYPQASISAQLRHLRKAKNGGYVVEKRPRGDRRHGLWEYRVTEKKEAAA